MRRSCLLAAVIMLAAAPAAWAGPGGKRTGPATGHGNAGPAQIVPAGGAGAPLLTDWWRAPLSRSSEDPDNPFLTGGCVQVQRYLALDYGGQCTVPAGTWIFEVGFTTECSNIEDPPFHADTPQQARLCGLANDELMSVIDFSLDGGEPVSVLGRRFGAFLNPTRIVIPDSPLFGGTPGDIMRYGGHGYVALIKPLPIGDHSLQLHAEGTAVGVPEEGYDAESTITVTG